MKTPMICLSIMALVIAACGDPLSGQYSDAEGLTTYDFKPGGQAVISVLGTQIAAEYTVDGDKVLLSSPQGTIVLTRRDDHLLGPMGMKLARQTNQHNN